MIRIYLVVICCISLLTGLVGQDERPKVGLVLSGGSAHGLAHVGVLKVLEQRGVKIDFITGTSMGSIIGGLYAMGMSADEIEDLAIAQDWTSLLATDVPIRDIAPSEKAYHNRYPLTLKVKDGSFRLPEGFLNSQNLDILLNQMFLPAHDIAHFDNLPIPFRAIAVDIVDGEVVVLDQGYLGQAVRASMAIPSVFSPVEYDDKLLVDGGLIRNFPVEEVISMGADIVIGVYVGSKLDEKEELRTLLDILNQSAFMMGILDSEEQKILTDILIEPDVKELPSFGFDMTEVLVREGLIATADYIDQLDSIKAIQDRYVTVSPEPLSASDQINVKRTSFPFLRDPYDALARFKYGSDNLSKSVSLNRVESGISKIFGSKHFEQVNYTLQSDDDGENTLAILATPRKVNTLSGAFNFFPSAGTALVITHESRNLLAKPSVLYTTVRAAQNFGFKSDFFYRLGKKKDFMLALHGKLHKYDQNLYDRDDLLQKYKENQALLLMGIGYEPSNDFLLSGFVGLDGYRLNAIGSGQDGLDRYGRLDGILRANITIDRLTDPIFYKSGLKIEVQAEAHALFADQLTEGENLELTIPSNTGYLSAQFKAEGGINIDNIFSLGFTASAGFKSKPSLLDNYRIGGFENRDVKSIGMLGLSTHQFHMHNYAKGGLYLRSEIWPSIFIGGEVNRLLGQRAFVSSSVELGEELDFLSYGGFVGIDTPIGPLRIGIGRNTMTSSWQSNFAFGYTFF